MVKNSNRETRNLIRLLKAADDAQQLKSEDLDNIVVLPVFIQRFTCIHSSSEGPFDAHRGDVGYLPSVGKRFG